MKTTPLEKAIELCGGIAATAEKVGVKPTNVSRWRIRGQVSSTHTIKLEEATDGRVTRYKLRPDIFGKAA